MSTLKELVKEYGANGFVFADAGNGNGIGEEGRFVVWDQDTEAAHGDVKLSPLTEPHRSADGLECTHGSDWIKTGEGDNPYRCRIYF